MANAAGALLSVHLLQLEAQRLSCCFLKQSLLSKHFCSQPIVCDLKVNLPSLTIRGPSNSKGNYYKDLKAESIEDHGQSLWTQQEKKNGLNYGGLSENVCM